MFESSARSVDVRRFSAGAASFALFLAGLVAGDGAFAEFSFVQLMVEEGLLRCAMI